MEDETSTAFTCPHFLTMHVVLNLGEKDVYHWNLATANSQPEKIFQRAGKLAEAGTQIINYSANSQARLTKIKPDNRLV